MSILLIIAVIVTLVWTPILATRGSLVVGCLVYLLLANCFGNYFLEFTVGPISMTSGRFFLIALVGCYVYQRWLGRGEPKPIGRDEVLLGGFVALLITSAFLHNVPTGDGQPVMQHLINGYLIPLTLFWIARESKLTERHMKIVHVSLVAFGVYLAITGLLEISGQWAFVFPRYIADPEAGIHFGRARGPMVSSVSYGLTLCVAIFSGWTLWPRASRRWQLLLITFVPLAAAGIFLSYTRSVWMGAALGLIVLMLTTLRGQWRTAVVGTVVVSAALVASTNFDSILAFNRNDNSAAQTRGSVSIRGTFAYVSWLMFQDQPLLGVGFGQFPTAKLPYLSDRSSDLNLEAIRPYVHHNMLLSVLTEVGLIGLLMFVGVFVYWAIGAWRLRQAAGAPPWARQQGPMLLAVLAAYLCQALFHEMSFTPLDHGLVFFVAGLAAALRPLAITKDPCITAQVCRCGVANRVNEIQIQKVHA